MSHLFPDYKNSIVNLTASILKHYNADSAYAEIKELDNILEKKFKNVILIVLDGFGMSILEKNLPDDSFMKRHLLKTITSVFPSTTTAAMTTYYSGVSPNEHGWIGWSLYFKEYSRMIDIFTNRDSYTKEEIGNIHAAYKLMPYERIYEKIDRQTNGEVKVYTVNPKEILFPEKSNTNIGVESFNELTEKIKETSEMNKNNFIMAYWNEPDTTMHVTGCYSKEAKQLLIEIDKNIEELCSNIKDSVVIISADHGQIDIENEIYLEAIPDLMECLILPPSIEPRAAAFFVKPEFKIEFKRRFENIFGDEFVLYTKEEIENNRVLGLGKQHYKIADFTGDYIAVAKGKAMIQYRTMNTNEKTKKKYKGHHAGLTKDEMVLPLIVIEKNR